MGTHEHPLRRDGCDEVAAITLGKDLQGARAPVAGHPQGWSVDEALEWLIPAGHAARNALVPTPQPIG